MSTSVLPESESHGEKISAVSKILGPCPQGCLSGMFPGTVYILLMETVSIAHGKLWASIRMNHKSLGKRSYIVTRPGAWKNLYKRLKICHLCTPLKDDV